MNLRELTKWYDFTGKTAVITGGTGVLGGEMACALVGLGANVAVLTATQNCRNSIKSRWMPGRVNTWLCMAMC